MAENETPFLQQLFAGHYDEEGSFPAAFAIAEGLQTHFAFQDPAPGGRRRAGRRFGASFEAWDPGSHAMTGWDPGSDVIMTGTADDAWDSPTASAAPYVWNRESAQNLSDRQYAMKIAADEQRIQRDMEFAKALQRLEDAGVDPSDTIEDTLGRDIVESTTVSDSFSTRSYITEAL